MSVLPLLFSLGFLSLSLFAFFASSILTRYSVGLFFNLQCKVSTVTPVVSWFYLFILKAIILCNKYLHQNAKLKQNYVVCWKFKLTTVCGKYFEYFEIKLKFIPSLCVSMWINKTNLNQKTAPFPVDLIKK